QQFGVLVPQASSRSTQEELIGTFIQRCMSSERDKEAHLARMESVLESIAELWPSAWQAVANFRIKFNRTQATIEYALRRAVEEMPFSKDAWLQRARFAGGVGDKATQILSLVSAVEASPSDVHLIREVAYEVCTYVSGKKGEIPRTVRGVYLAGVRAHMERI